MAHSIPWPGGARCAVIFSFDVDGESSHVAADRQNAERLSVLSMGAYGPELGLPRILSMLEAESVPATFFVPGLTARLHPGAVEAIVAGGHETGHHSYWHKRVDEQSPAEFEEDLLAASDLLQRLTGRRPVGYRAPLWEITRPALALLGRHGFRYDSTLMGDDLPYRVETGGGELLELPVSWLLDDWEQFAYSITPSNTTSIEEPDKVFRLWAAEFDARYEEGGFFLLTMHPQLIGRPSRVRLLQRLIHHVRTCPGVWITTCGEATAHLRQLGNTLVLRRPPGPADFVPSP